MSLEKSFQEIRKEYQDRGIDEASLTTNPMELFQSWFDIAIQHQPSDWFEPNAMSLATAGKNGVVTNRYVLMKGVMPSGIQFFTNYDSRKGNQLAENPQAAVVFHWPYLGRQLRMEGRVEKTTREVSESYFHSRPRGSQIGAAVSPQSQSVADSEALAQLAAGMSEDLAGAPVPCPEHWGGYLLVATKVEFWQGRANRLHDRMVYQLEDNGEWTRTRIAP